MYSIYIDDTKVSCFDSLDEALAQARHIYLDDALNDFGARYIYVKEDDKLPRFLKHPMIND